MSENFTKKKKNGPTPNFCLRRRILADSLHKDTRAFDLISSVTRQQFIAAEDVSKESFTVEQYILGLRYV
jgi:hypothetical protein